MLQQMMKRAAKMLSRTLYIHIKERAIKKQGERAH
jgi:hypothetical protein